MAKGLDFPNVALVGIISADTTLNMPVSGPVSGRFN